MNDATFVNYESYYSSTSQQVVDGVALTPNGEYEEQPPTIHYLSNVPSDIPSLSQTSVDQRHQQTSLFTFIPNSHEEQPQKTDGQCSTNRTVSGAVANSGSVFGNIPFVQIHTTDVQPQRTSYGNVFRRHISKQEEIKSEPIKSENADAAKERTNATPTPPRPSNPSQSEDNMAATTSNEDQLANISNDDEENPCPVLKIFKCSQCPFISLKDTERINHVASQHGESVGSKNQQRQPINCPGCSNIFYTIEPLELHLKLDHLMRDEEILKLIEAFTQPITKSAENISSPTYAANITTDIASSELPVRKSRIYLKNVDCLREPNRLPMEQRENQLYENNSSHSLEASKANPTKQKISIKSVDVLREPALLRRDYEMQSSNLNNFMNFNTDLIKNNMDLLKNPMTIDTTNGYEYNKSLENSLGKTNFNNDDSEIVNSNKTNAAIDAADKPRRPKIYVKSVESFNLMPLDTLHTTNATGYINNHNGSCNNSQPYDSNVVHLPYIFESGSAGNNINGATNFANNHTDVDTFQFTTASNSSNNYTIDSSLFLGDNEEINEACEEIRNVALLTNTTNVDISSVMNRPLAAIQEQRGTLHLRTVDELNLMNKTEVQHLIAPNLDNSHGTETVDKVNSSSLSDINLIGDDLYEDDNLKFHDLDTQMVNNWAETYEDLADINCIIAVASNDNRTENLTYTNDNNNQKLNSSNFDIDSPQVSLITIRDIEELTGTTTHAPESIAEQIQDSQNLIPAEIDIENQEPYQKNQQTVSDSNLKRELVNTPPESNEALIVTNVTITNGTKDATKKALPSISELPPLIRVTNSSADSPEASSRPTSISSLANSSLRLPPLVPVSNMKMKNSANSSITKPTSPLEKGRIYVANNLMEPPKRMNAVSATSGTSVRGRPFGSNQTRITKLKHTIGNSAEDLFSKCSVKGCAFRFKKSATVEYHRKCHELTSDSPQAMICPECKSTEFNNWNTLHTHLWRAHQVDMELYKCELCEFRTPIFSRLVNTHAKIHFEDRNYKCQQCDKAFKNSRQLKNHRRWHRVQASADGGVNIPKTPYEIHRCPGCGSTFSQQKSLREHCCKKGNASLKCTVCEKLMSSKSSLKLHLLTHSDGEKRYKCQNCDYATNDHNAFRRHRMGHENRKMYACNFCSYKSVQSVAYQKHVLQKHPNKASSVIHKCTVCTYSTINRFLLVVHQAKHEETKILDETSPTNNQDKSVVNNVTKLQMSKIKVKSNLFTTNIKESAQQISTANDSGSVT